MKDFLLGALSVILVYQVVLPKYVDDLWYLEQEYNISFQTSPLN